MSVDEFIIEVKKEYCKKCPCSGFCPELETFTEIHDIDEFKRAIKIVLNKTKGGE